MAGRYYTVTDLKGYIILAEGVRQNAAKVSAFDQHAYASGPQSNSVLVWGGL